MKKYTLLFSLLFLFSGFGIDPNIHGNYKGRQLVFDGNSLTNLGNNSLTLNGFYYATKTYAALVAAGEKFSYQNYAISGRTTAVLISEFSTKVAPNVKPNDILVFWEITNDAASPSLTSTDLYNNVVTYCGLARAAGLKVICLTGTACTDATRFGKIDGCNTLIRANHSFCDAIVDVGALSQFDAIADASSGTYYAGDGLHLSNAGYDLIAAAVQPVIVTVRALP